MDTKIEDRQIQDWFHNFITLFRKKYSGLSEFERTGIHGVLDFSKPCQVEIFLLKYPEIQLIILSKIPERKDMEVTVHGPFEGNEFIEKVEKILSDERWQKKPEHNDEHEDFEIFMDFGEPDDTLGDILAKRFYQMIDTAKHSLFYSSGSIDSFGIDQISRNIWTDIRTGNILKTDYNEKVEDAIKKIKETARIQDEWNATTPRLVMESLKRQKPFNSLPMQAQQTGGHGFGIHIFPPVRIGKTKKPTIHQFLNGAKNDTTIFDKSFDLMIKGRVVIVNRDGYVFIETNKKEQAMKILNLIMALGTLITTPMFAVREQDLSIASFDKNRTIVSKQWRPGTLRSQLHDNSSMHDFSLNESRFELTEKELTDIILSAFEVIEDNDIANNLKLFVEALTHNRSTEYSQSFVMSWSILEQHYSSLWGKMLNKKQLDKNRLEKLQNPNQWSIDYKLEILNLLGKIDEQDYKVMMELKKKRNNFYHGREQISQEDSVKSLKLARKIIDDKINFSHSE